MPLEGIHVFDVVAPPVLADQLVAEAQRIAEVPLALYVVDIDGSHLLRVAGPDRLPERIEVPLAIGPKLDAAGLDELRAGLANRPGIEVIPLWLRGRATGVMLTLGRPRRPLTEIARQAGAAITLADRYTDTFARAQRCRAVGDGRAFFCLQQRTDRPVANAAGSPRALSVMSRWPLVDRRASRPGAGRSPSTCLVPDLGPHAVAAFSLASSSPQARRLCSSTIAWK